LPAIGEQLYVTEKLVVGIYATPALDGERLAVVRSADQVEVLAREDESAQVRLADGTEGWMKASYLESEPPLSLRISDLENENRKLRTAAAKPGDQATTLQKENTQLRSQLDSARRELDQLRNATPVQVARPDDDAPIETVKPRKNTAATTAALVILAAAAALGGGFAWGYFHLDRRIRRKFGGLKPW
jgi:SH3 domain protein